MKTVSAVVAALAALAGGAGEVRLRGPEGARLDACIERNVAKTDPLYLAECFSRRNESRLWQSEFWGKYMHSAVPYWQYTIENNRIEGDGSGATTLPEKAFHPKGLGE